MAGAAAGFAGWTKNEGTLFILVILASHFAGAALRRGWAEYPRELLRLAIGLAPGILLLGAFRLFLSPPSDVQLDSAALHRLTVVDRYPQVVAGFVDKFKAFGGWWNSGIHPGVVVVLFLLLYLTSIRNIKATSLNLLFVPLFMMAGYFMVYIITPYELQWHINTSLDRLLLQLWPASVFILSAISVTRESADVQAGTLVLEHP
jgi:hypothetical protein